MKSTQDTLESIQKQKRRARNEVLANILALAIAFEGFFLYSLFFVHGVVEGGASVESCIYYALNLFFCIFFYRVFDTNYTFWLRQHKFFRKYEVELIN